MGAAPRSSHHIQSISGVAPRSSDVRVGLTAKVEFMQRVEISFRQFSEYSLLHDNSITLITISKTGPVDQASITFRKADHDGCA
jgi:hypothetical protein